MNRTADILDENGTVIDTESLDEAHAKGLLHRSVHVLVVDNAGRVFVRRRPHDKPIYPGQWTSSVGTHVLHGKNPDDVAQVALKDFLGLDSPMRRLGEQRIHDEFENEIITVYSCEANAVTDLNPKESSEGAFTTIKQVRQLGNAHKATPHLLGALEVYQNSLAV